MTLNPATLLTTRITCTAAIAALLLAIYLGAIFLLFFTAVVPSYERGTTSEDFAVDSTIYTEYADTLREGRPNPVVLESLAAFPNTFWAPVSIALVLNSAFLEMLLNLALFAASILILGRALPISRAVFVVLLILNATTATSLLCINKEILDLFCLALFLYWRSRRSHTTLLLALGIAFINRFEFFLVLLGFMIALSRANPWREKRWITLLLLLAALNFLMPIWAAHDLARRFEEAQYGGMIRALDELQMHYLYFVAVIPKIADNLFSGIINPNLWNAPNSWLYINMLDNLAYVALLSMLAIKRQLTLRKDLMYLGAIGAILVAQSMVYQPRYFYFIYVLLCLQASYNKSRGTETVGPPCVHAEFVNA